MKMVNESLFMFAFRSPNPLYQVHIIIIAAASVNMTKPANAYNVLATVNNIFSKNIKVHTDNKKP